ncbi:MAG: hypothetical protein WCP85_08605 [Mariniphaga sp.]
MNGAIIKYNEWCERKPLICSDIDRINQAYNRINVTTISDSAKSAILLNELYGCNGLEFVLFSNSKITNGVNFPNGIIIKPCFLASTNSQLLTDPYVFASILMERSSKFVYDCWLPINNWEENNLNCEIRRIDETPSLFSMLNGLSMIWEPKYHISRISKSTHYIAESEINELFLLISKTQVLFGEDRIAFFRSLAWLKRAETIDDFPARFLFCMLSLESMVGYIENEAEDSSYFAKFRSVKKTKNEINSDRILLIHKALNDDLEKRPFKAIVDAYFNGVISIKSTLEKHLTVIFHDDLTILKRLFNPKDNSLYDVRSKIAHGKTDIIDEIEKKEVLYKSYEIESIARLYLWRILGFESVNKSSYASMTGDMQNGIISSESMYRGPKLMALLYI